MQVTHTDCETVQLLPTSRGVMNLENEKERAQFSFRSHCRSEKDSEVPALLKTGFSAIISLSISSAVRWTQDNRPEPGSPTRARCESVMTWGSPRLLSGNNWPDSLNYFLDCIRKEHFVCLVLWYNLTVLRVILKPSFHGCPIFFFFILEEEWWMLSSSL